MLSHILMFKKNDMPAMLVFQASLVVVELFHIYTLSFVLEWICIDAGNVSD